LLCAQKNRNHTSIFIVLLKNVNIKCNFLTMGASIDKQFTEKGGGGQIHYFCLNQWGINFDCFFQARRNHIKDLVLFYPLNSLMFYCFNLDQGCTTQIKSGPKKIKTILRAKFDAFACKISYNTQLNLWYSISSRVGGPNVKPRRVTFGPRAVCWACLI